MFARRSRLFSIALGLLVSSALYACGGDSEDSSDNNVAGSAGSAGSAEGAGSGGDSGEAGSAGESGAAGSAGENAEAGSGGDSGEAGSAGEAGAGGFGGDAGSAGESGDDTISLPSAVPTFALRTVFAGDTTRDGVASNDAWKQFGFDLDGQKSTPQSTGHCKARQGGSVQNIQDDGDDGIDNSFARNVLPQLSPLGIDPTQISSNISAYIGAGVFSMLLKIDGLPQDGNGTGLPTSIFAARGQLDESTPSGYVYPTQQQWQDGSYLWRVLSSSVKTTSPLQAEAFFPNSTAVNRLWTSGSSENSSLMFIVPFEGVELSLRLHSVRVSATISEDGKSATGGMIGGVLALDELASEIKNLIGQVSPAFCSISDMVISQVSTAADIMLNGTQDPNSECDGVSIGLGFEAQSAQFQDIITAPESPSGCDLRQAARVLRSGRARRRHRSLNERAMPGAASRFVSLRSS